MAGTASLASCTHVVGSGVKIAYRILGGHLPGTPLVLVQGLSGVKEDWRDFAVSLAKQRPVVVFDNRGMGDSECPRGAFSMQDMADDCASLIRGILALPRYSGFSRVHLCGISMGGMISQTVVTSHGELIDRLVLGCTHSGGEHVSQPDPAFMRAFSVEDFKRMGPFAYGCRLLAFNYTRQWIRDHQTVFEELVRDSLKTRRPSRTIGAQVVAIMGYDVEDQISKIPHQTLVVHGTGDQVVPYENGVRLVEAIPDAGLLRLPGVGHVFWDMDGGEAAEAIAAFLSTPAPTHRSRL